ncbi:4Fe-4S binding protein [Methanothermobacter wolfeii]|uniref:4Fe-4S binding protein n=1 Tax=Methanothermobacter wolfeii TaxID=145261 RepID=A0A9E7RUD2_METWO|nr:MULTISPECIES: 4Fe-4S binding protein [Methanothermobacter]MDI6702932.1 4Fe-4S binding protein [Methanothermobacter wolfeii]MDI6841458.1 4Fe-4S binding protein [Methanothermobacter wolfeii]UXH31981.1 4Fe-4S binding protein [Methanothermobacter wolfeii]
MKHERSRCMLCGACENVCPYDIIEAGAKPKDECRGCGRCAAVCPVDAIGC